MKKWMMFAAVISFTSLSAQEWGQEDRQQGQEWESEEDRKQKMAGVDAVEDSNDIADIGREFPVDVEGEADSEE